MEISKATTDQNDQYKIMRWGFIIFLLISPLLPYIFTMAYNSYLFVTLPARVKALPVHPETRLVTEMLKQDTETGNCLQLSVQYATDIPLEITPGKYEALLLQSGWHKHDSTFPYYTKGTMNIEIREGKYRLSLFLKVDTLPIFQLGCMP